MVTVHIRLYKTSVYALFTLNRVVHKFATGVTVASEQALAHLPDIEQGYVNMTKLRVEKLVGMIQPDTTRAHIKQAYKQLKADELPYKATILDMLLLYARKQAHKVSEARQERYQVLQHVWRDFETHRNGVVYQEDFEKLLFEEWIIYLQKKRNSGDNTVAAYCSTLHGALVTVLPDQNWKFVRYKAYVPKVVYLLSSEIKQLWMTELTPYLAEARDLFIFACVTGLRYSDTQVVDHTWVVEGVLMYHQQKGEKEVAVPISGLSELIFQKYGGSLPKLSNVMVNRMLKEVGKLAGLNRAVHYFIKRGNITERKTAPLHQLISTHKARKTFIMLCLNNQVALKDVMDMSGHGDLRAMKPYMDLTKGHIKTTRNMLNNLT